MWVKEYKSIENEIAIKFDVKNEPVILKPCVGNETTGNIYHLLYTENRIALYVNYILNDEDWPLGNITDINLPDPVKTMSVDDFLPLIKNNDVKITHVNGWSPVGHNTNAGDCMPFSHNGVYHLFYLFDRRNHRSKWGLGAHQWAHISTTDFIDWTQHPMAISIDYQYEGSICTGSIMEHNGLYYAYYAVRMSDGSPARLTYSISDDCINFKKTNKYITLHEPFEPVSARDPKIILGQDGKFHMFVTTSYKDSGALAHLISDNMEEWTQFDEPVVTSSKGDWQPECPDYFYYNGWYYLIYSPNGTRYVMSREPFGPWTTPDNNVLTKDILGIVPKTAIFNNRIIIAGWIGEENKWGGTLKLGEALQNDDGTLQFTPFEL
jgi:Beta-fructosidases (levanase/invertase)